MLLQDRELLIEHNPPVTRSSTDTVHVPQYAEALIRLLDAISEKSEFLPGEVDKYLVTAINSLRSADSVRLPMIEDLTSTNVY